MVRERTWVFYPVKSKVPSGIKDQVMERANHLIESELKPHSVKHKPLTENSNYVVDIYAKWYRSYFYFCAKYQCPSPNHISEFLENKFARLEYLGKDSFNLSYMRHTGQWWELYSRISLKECLDRIRKEPHFLP